MNIIQDILPNQLKKLFETDDFEDNGGMIINKLDYSNEDLKVTFHLNTGEDDNEVQTQIWEIKIRNLKSEKIVIEWTEDLSFYKEHFLLWQYTNTWTNLYFKGPTENPDKLLTDLYKSHRLKFGHWIDLEEYLNVQPDLFSLCNSSIGLFANGPKIILDIYKECLDRHNKNPHYQGEYNQNDISNNETLGLLFIGKSYFIGSDFTFNCIQ